MRGLKLMASQIAVAAVMATGSAAAHAYGFECVNLSLDCTAAGTSVASWDLVGNVLTIRNENVVGNLSSITGVSFDAAAGQTVSLADPQSAGVLFAEGVGANLPTSLGWTVDFKFSPDKKPMSNGVNAGESLAFNLSGVKLADIQSGAFRFGIHIQGLPTAAGSEKLINITPSVPEPEAYAMVLAGVAVAGGLMRRRGVSRVK